MKIILTLVAAISLLGPLAAAYAGQAQKPVSSSVSAKAAQPSPAYLCANKARANKLEGVEFKLFMSGCLQSKSPATFK